MIPVAASLIVLLLVSQTACVATMVEKHQALSVRSDPPGASVSIDGFRECVTPCRTLVDRKPHELTIAKSGYAQENLLVDTKFSPASVGWFAVGILLWGPFEPLVDLFTLGKFKELEEDQIRVNLTRRR